MKNQKQRKGKVKENQHVKVGKKVFKSSKGITLIALVITIIVLLILARSGYCNTNRREWNTK